MPAAETTSTLLLVKYGILASLAASAAAILENVDSQLPAIKETTLLLICLASAIGGSIVCIFMFPEKTPRQTAAKFSGSVIASAIVSPYVLFKLEMSGNIYSIIFVSGSTAFMIWTVLETAMPIFQRWAAKFTKRKLESLEGKE